MQESPAPHGRSLLALLATATKTRARDRPLHPERFLVVPRSTASHKKPAPTKKPAPLAAYGRNRTQVPLTRLLHRFSHLAQPTDRARASRQEAHLRMTV